MARHGSGGGTNEARVEASRRSENAESLRIVTRIQAGERHLMAALFERYFHDIYGYLATAVHRNEVDDVLQQVFIRLLKEIPRYDIRPDSFFRGWIFRIARNTASDFRRRRDPVAVLPPDELRVEIEGRANGLASGLDPARAFSWLSDEHLITALRGLNEVSREVVLLHYAAGLSLAEIAVALNKPEDTVRKIRNRALASLRMRLLALEQPSGGRRRPLAMSQLSCGTRRSLRHTFSVLGS